MSCAFGNQSKPTRFYPAKMAHALIRDAPDTWTLEPDATEIIEQLVHLQDFAAQILREKTRQDEFKQIAQKLVQRHSATIPSFASCSQKILKTGRSLLDTKGSDDQQATAQQLRSIIGSISQFYTLVIAHRKIERLVHLNLDKIANRIDYTLLKQTWVCMQLHEFHHQPFAQQLGVKFESPFASMTPEQMDDFRSKQSFYIMEALQGKGLKPMTGSVKYLQRRGISEVIESGLDKSTPFYIKSILCEGVIDILVDLFYAYKPQNPRVVYETGAKIVMLTQLHFQYWILTTFHQRIQAESDTFVRNALQRLCVLREINGIFRVLFKNQFLVKEGAITPQQLLILISQRQRMECLLVKDMDKLLDGIELYQKWRSGEWAPKPQTRERLRETTVLPKPKL